jgi:hypothetical protein
MHRDVDARVLLLNLLQLPRQRLWWDYVGSVRPAKAEFEYYTTEQRTAYARGLRLAI